MKSRQMCCRKMTQNKKDEIDDQESFVLYWQGGRVLQI